MRQCLMALAVSACLFVASVCSAETIRVGAAISLKDALVEISKAFETETGDHVDCTFGSSGSVAGQIRAGAPVDVFVSAAEAQVKDLGEAKLVDAASRVVVAKNSVVLVVPADAKETFTSFEDLRKLQGKLAVGEPKAVPAGMYAMQVLKALKLDDLLKPKMIFAGNVRQVLAYVERGEVAAGIVYGTDAKESGDKVKVVATADESAHEPVVYPAVVVASTKQKAVAEKFLKFLGSAKSRAVFEARGFGKP